MSTNKPLDKEKSTISDEHAAAISIMAMKAYYDRCIKRIEENVRTEIMGAGDETMNYAFAIVKSILKEEL